MFKHFLITRYNVRVDQWDLDIYGQSTRQDDWMHHRFNLFSQYCFPSVIAQSAKEFKWLIYFDRLTSPEHLQQINSLVGPYDFIQIRLVSDLSNCIMDIDNHLKEIQTPYVITSRLDNDDGLGVDYIKTVQSHFLPRDKWLINLLHGYSYDPRKKVVTKLYAMQFNHFSSLIEEHKSTGGHITVRGFPHGKPPPEISIVNVDSTYSWIKVFHERNALSTPFGYPVLMDHFSKHYGIEKKYLRINIISTLGYAMHWLWDGVNRKIVKRFTAEIR